MLVRLVLLLLLLVLLLLVLLTVVWFLWLWIVHQAQGRAGHALNGGAQAEA